MINPASASLLLRQFRELTDSKKAIPSFHISLEDDNIYIWNVGVMVLNEESAYHGGYFKAQMRFPQDFPFSPPTFRFTPAIYHPNVYRDGRLCISILHSSGDPTSGELDAETWSPAQSVESVLISIVSLLEDPNISSPANVDAAVEWKKDHEAYKKRVDLDVQRSKQDIPEGFIMPKASTAYVGESEPPKVEEEVGDEFWVYDSDEEEMEEDDLESYESDSLMDNNDEEEEEEEEESSDNEGSTKLRG